MFTNEVREGHIIGINCLIAERPCSPCSGARYLHRPHSEEAHIPLATHLIAVTSDGDRGSGSGRGGGHGGHLRRRRARSETFLCRWWEGIGAKSVASRGFTKQVTLVTQHDSGQHSMQYVIMHISYKTSQDSTSIPTECRNWLKLCANGQVDGWLRATNSPLMQHLRNTSPSNTFHTLIVSPPCRWRHEHVCLSQPTQHTHTAQRPRPTQE